MIVTDNKFAKQAAREADKSLGLIKDQFSTDEARIRNDCALVFSILALASVLEEGFEKLARTKKNKK